MTKTYKYMRGTLAILSINRELTPNRNNTFGERWCLKCFTTLYLWHCLLLSGVVWPCLADGNKLRQLFTNLLSSSLQFSSSRSKSIQAECHKIASKRPVCTNFNCSRIALLCPYLRSRLHMCGRKRARDTVFISTVVLFRLINAEFHKKIGSFGAGAAPDVYLKEKPRGGFLSASSHWFSRVGVNQTLPLPLLTLKLPQPFSLCPILIQHLPVLLFCQQFP